MNGRALILSSGIAVIEDDSHFTKWVKESGRLDHDPSVVNLCKLIDPSKSAIDVGAYIGDHTIAYLRATKEVFAFEPNPIAFECLKHNCPKAVFLNSALGARDGVLWWVETKPNYGSSYLTYDHQDGALQVPVLPLDSFAIINVGYIKIDIEGWECELFKGAMDTIAESRPVICIEVNRACLIRAGSSPEELISILDRLDYNIRPLTAIHPLMYDLIAEPRRRS